MKKQRLDAGIRFDFEVFGIVTVFKDYKLAWVINKTLSIDLARKEDLILRFIDHNLEISNYSHSTENTRFRLLRNKSQDSEFGESLHLIPELPSIDFFLTISTSPDFIDEDSFVSELRRNKGIEYVGKIDLSTLKSRENFLE